MKPGLYYNSFTYQTNEISIDNQLTYISYICIASKIFVKSATIEYIDYNWLIYIGEV